MIRRQGVSRERMSYCLLASPLLLNVLSFGQHALVENSRYYNALTCDPVEQNMPPVLHAPQAGPNLIAGAAQFWILSKLLTACFKGADIMDGLIFTPCIEGVIPDVHQVCLSQVGKTICTHWLDHSSVAMPSKAANCSSNASS